MSEQLLNKILEKLVSMETELHEVKATMATKEELVGVKQSLARMETTMVNNFGGLFDAREVQNDVNERILASLERIEAKTENHDIKIAVLDRRKRIVKA